MSNTVVVHPIIVAVKAADRILGRGRRWKPSNEEQRALLEMMTKDSNSLTHFSPGELTANASIEGEPGDDNPLVSFSLSATLNVEVAWRKKGEKSTVAYRGTKYDAADVSTGISGSDAPGHKHPIASLSTQSEDIVYLTIADKPRSGFDLLRYIDQLRESRMTMIGECDYVRFPMIDCDDAPNLQWMLGLETTYKNTRFPATLTKAKQRTEFKMNEVGAHVRSRVDFGGMVVGSAISRRPRSIIVDKPFFLWIERRDVALPIMYAYFTPESWKNPKSLRMDKPAEA